MTAAAPRKKREGRRRHAPVADRDQIGQPASRPAPRGWRSGPGGREPAPTPRADAGHLLAQGLAGLEPLGALHRPGLGPVRLAMAAASCMVVGGGHDDLTRPDGRLLDLSPLELRRLRASCFSRLRRAWRPSALGDFVDLDLGGRGRRGPLRAHDAPRPFTSPVGPPTYRAGRVRPPGSQATVARWPASATTKRPITSSPWRTVDGSGTPCSGIRRRGDRELPRRAGQPQRRRSRTRPTPATRRVRDLPRPPGRRSVRPQARPRPARLGDRGPDRAARPPRCRSLRGDGLVGRWSVRVGHRGRPGRPGHPGRGHRRVPAARRSRRLRRTRRARPAPRHLVDPSPGGGPRLLPGVEASWPSGLPTGSPSSRRASSRGGTWIAGRAGRLVPAGHGRRRRRRARRGRRLPGLRRAAGGSGPRMSTSPWTSTRAPTTCSVPKAWADELHERIPESTSP